MQVRNMSEWCVFAHSKAIHGQAHGESSMHSGSLSGDESKGSNSGATALSALGKFVIKHFKNCNDRMDAVAALNRILSYISSHADNQACSQAFMLAGSIATRLNALDVMRSLLYSVAFGRESEKLLKKHYRRDRYKCKKQNEEHPYPDCCWQWTSQGCGCTYFSKSKYQVPRQNALDCSPSRCSKFK